MELEKLLDHIPQLVKTYGKWPSYAYLLFATGTRGPVLGALATAFIMRWLRDHW